MRVWRTLRKEEVIPMHLANGLLLAHYKERRSRICQEVPRLPSSSQLNPHSLLKLAKLGHSVAVLYLGA